jgi:ZIP family zinc transporter
MTSNLDLIIIGTLASLIAGSATVLGAAAVFFVRRLSEKFLDGAMGFAAGVMLAATFFGLITPAIMIGGVWKTAAGLLVGAAFLIVMEKVVPHVHRVTGIKGPPIRLNKLWLFILAITIHNLPEGLAVGVGFAGGNIAAGTVLAIGIGIQNIIEGLAVSVSFYRTNNMLMKAFLVASFTCVVEPIGGLIGISVVSVSKTLIPYGLAFAAGAMLFVTAEELIPETHSRGNVRESTIGIMLGFVAMMILERVFG